MANTTCTRCGRKLTDPRSVARGVGPKCAKRIAAKAQEVMAAYKPEQVRKALTLIADGGLVPVRLGSYTAVSSSGRDHYRTDGTMCTCPAGQHMRACYHMLAARLVAA